MALSGTLLPLAAARGYSGSSADTSDSGGDMSISGRSYGAGQSVRTIVLCRRHGPVHLSNFGFALRGGKEFGTGCFVTSVERNSEAYSQGLMVGDQIIRVNGYPIEDATHKEVLSLIQNQMNVHLKVRSVGMVPNKDSFNDTLIWRIIEPDPGITIPPDEHSDLCNDHAAIHSSDVRLVINVPPRAKLGCGICKGPDWKPGIFIQFTKENSLARNAGLRQGDQIMQCNNVLFTPYMEFTEATSVLRNSGVLDLIVRKGSGLDLFPGESSGYNSSASSVAGDQSPETWPNKRLSIVKEESIIDSERLSHCDRNGNERRSEVPSNSETKPKLSDGACTVIHVGPSINKAYETRSTVTSDNTRNNNNKLAEICMVSKQLETTTTTVLVEVHQTEEETNNSQSDTGSCQLTNSSSACSLASSGANSLCSAISQELQRRSERRINEKNASQPQLELIKSGFDKEKVEQHQQLMEEFKRAHRKMFSTEVLGDRNEEPRNNSAKYAEERELQSSKQPPLQEQNRTERNQEKFQPKHQNVEEVDSTRHIRRQIGVAPPPPPLPKEGQSPPRAPPFPPPSPPDCPTPDYDTQSLTSEVSVQANKSIPVLNRVKSASSDFVEMQSIESFKLTNPSVIKPKPPPTYFKNKSSDSSSISRETVKPTVTIREYPSNHERKLPEKFSFLNQAVDGSTLAKDEPLTSRLQNELTQTLSRANLKANKEVTTNGTSKNVVTISINASQQPPATESSIKQNPFFLFQNDKVNDRLRNDVSNSSNTKMVSSTSLNSSEQNNVNLKRSSIHFPIDNSNKGSVTFNFGKSEKPDSRVVTVVQPNGILKNGPVGNVSQVQINSALHCNKTSQKNIKFGGITTITQNNAEPKM